MNPAHPVSLSQSWYEHLSLRQFFLFFFLKLVKEDSLFKDMEISFHNFSDSKKGFQHQNKEFRNHSW